MRSLSGVNPFYKGVTRRFQNCKLCKTEWFFNQNKLITNPKMIIKNTIHRKSPNPLGSFILIVNLLIYNLASINRFIFSGLTILCVTKNNRILTF